MKEIKTSDLRIGNMIFFDDPVDGELINKIDWHDLKWISEDYGTFNEFHRPIPLTEEWLERFGFQKRESSSCNAWYIGNNEITHDWLFDIVWLHRPELINSPNFPFYKNGRHLIQYVHTLQNLYHALTGEELTINN